MTEPRQTAEERQRTWLMDLNAENRDLAQTIDEMQAALDLIMFKHREQVQALVAARARVEADTVAHVARERACRGALERQVAHLTAKISEMTQVRPRRTRHPAPKAARPEAV